MANDNWQTPQYIFDWIENKLGFKFDLDVAADINNSKVEGCYLTEEDNALEMEWVYGLKCWLNPPYSDPAPWVKKAYEESLKGATVVCLLPADISTAWFHDWVIGKAEIWLIQGRIQFDGDKKGSPKFGSMVAIYSPGLIPGVKGVKRPDDPDSLRSRKRQGRDAAAV